MTKYKVVAVRICGVAINKEYANELKKELEDYYKDDDEVSIRVEELKKDDIF